MKSCHLWQHGWTLVLCQVRQVRERKILCDFTHVKSTKTEQNDQTKQNQTHRYRKQIGGYQRGRGLRDWWSGWRSGVWWWTVSRLLVMVTLCRRPDAELCRSPETYKMLYTNFISKKKKESLSSSFLLSGRLNCKTLSLIIMYLKCFKSCHPR